MFQRERERGNVRRGRSDLGVNVKVGDLFGFGNIWLAGERPFSTSFIT